MADADTRHADWVLNPKINKKWNSGARIDLRMYIRTWPAATPKDLYVQVNADKYDSDLPYAQYERNLAFNDQTWPAATPKRPYVQVNANIIYRPP